MIIHKEFERENKGRISFKYLYFLIDNMVPQSLRSNDEIFKDKFIGKQCKELE